MHSLRKYLTWVFAFTSLVCVQISFSITPRMLRRHAPAAHLPLTSRLLVIFLPWIFPVFAVVFGMAWWTSFKGKSSARIWGIVASLINIQVALFPLLIPPHSFWNGFLLILGIGIAGMIAFCRRIEPSVATPESRDTVAIPGDGTNNLINKAVLLLPLIAGAMAFSWWLGWLRRNEIFFRHTNSYLMMISFLLAILIVTLHEFGHAAIGLALGMKLRAFLVGPFQWCVRDGQWEFSFDPRRILVESGGAGLVPTVMNFPRSAYIRMLLGGVFVNAVTGGVALWVALSGESGSSVQFGGLLALFGAFSLVAVAVNLIPFRLQGGNYSDGAQIYQLLAKNIWADLHRAFGIAGASLVTPLRPRDYDIETIARASRGITQGPHALILRLLAYHYFFDKGDLAGAGEALGQAALIYNESASNVPDELLTVFVFGSAYIQRNAAAARAWWKHIEGKEPVRFNVDYWLAASSLFWVEGDMKEANESLEEANVLAQRLPKAGAYEFQRYCCSLLRHAFDEVPMRAI